MADLKAYSVNSFRTVNEHLRGGFKVVNAEVTDYVDRLKGILYKAPKFEGSVYRGISFRSRSKFKEFISEIEEGSLYIEKGFSSNSISEKIVQEFAEKDYNVTIITTSKKGVAIEGVSELAFEKEVLLDSGTKFRVNKVIKVDMETYTIEMEEL